MGWQCWTKDFTYSEKRKEIRHFAAKKFKEHLQKNNLTLTKFVEEPSVRTKLNIPYAQTARDYCSDVSLGRRAGAYDNSTDGYEFTELEKTRLEAIFKIVGVSDQDPILEQLRAEQPSKPFYGRKKQNKQSR